MAEKGYEATSVRDICKEAKVNFNAITYHLEKKTYSIQLFLV